MLARIKKDEELQEFSGFDTVSVFALAVGVVVIVWSLVTHAMNDQRLTRAHVEAERLALQLLSAPSPIVQDANLSRGPSSGPRGVVNSGQIGLDPWGRTYSYREMLDSESRRVIIVYSMGPDGFAQTTDQNFLVDQDGRLVDVRFSGDDVGTVQKSWH
jgi:hypothetical protein